MAARASSLLSAARTEQTLWLHEFSRRLAAMAVPLPAPVPVLAHELAPELRVVVLDVLSFGAEVADSFVVPDRRRERRSTLAVCRLVRDRPELEPLPEQEQEQERGEPAPLSVSARPTRETQGLVLFSLQDHLGQRSHPAAGSGPTIPSPSPPPPPSKGARRSDLALPGAPTTTKMRTVAVPTVPPDLRWIRPGVEVWIWEPFHEVGLVGVDDVRFDDESSGRQSVGSELGTGMPPGPLGGFAVGWQAGLAVHQETEQGPETVARKGLVCGRFAVLT